MSKISQDFISNIGYLYEQINIQQQNILNEESEYYDQEIAELVEDIISTISVSMVYEGYSANAVIGFLADSSEEEIIEKYLNFDENVLTESTVSEEYIEEQLEIFDAALNEGIGRLIGKVAKGAIGLAGRVASKPARMAVAKKLSSSANPEKIRAAAQRLAQREARRGNVGGYTKTSSPIGGGKPLSGKQSAELLSKAKLSQATQKVKDIGQGAKAALTSPTAKKVALGAAGLGAAGLAGGIGGYVGAKLAGAGSGSKSGESIKPPKSPTPTESPVAPQSLPRSDRGAAVGGGVRRPIAAAAPRQTVVRQTGDKKNDMATWEKANPKLAQAERLRASGAPRGEINKVLYDKGTAASQATGQSQMQRSAEELRQMTNRSKQRQGALMGGPEGPGQIDRQEVEKSIKDAQERQKKNLENQKNTTMTAKESYEPYEVLFDYLVNSGHADTIEEAHYIMMEMDSSAVCAVMEEYEDYLLAEEIDEWVNDLLDEGYDLSEYTWDDIVEYYVTEANREEEYLNLSTLQKIRRRNKEYFKNTPETVQKTTQRRGEHSVMRGIKKKKGEKSAFGTMRHVGGPYR